MAAGHSNAMRYPIGRLYFEAALINKRHNADAALAATLQFNAINAAFGVGTQEFLDSTRSMTDGG